jgi:hypothetical protein
MKKLCRVSRPIIFAFLVINQLYFSFFTLAKTDESNNSTANGTIIVKSFNIYESKANFNNKTNTYANLLSIVKFSSEKFYNIILSIAEEIGFLFFINSEKNPNSLLSVITEQSVPRSPPVS